MGAEKTLKSGMQNSNIPPETVTIDLLNMSNTSTMMPETVDTLGARPSFYMRRRRNDS
jgi:hypothetical protein